MRDGATSLPRHSGRTQHEARMHCPAASTKRGCGTHACRQALSSAGHNHPGCHSEPRLTQLQGHDSVHAQRCKPKGGGPRIEGQAVQVCNGPVVGRLCVPHAAARRCAAACAATAASCAATAASCAATAAAAAAAAGRLGGGLWPLLHIHSAGLQPVAATSTAGAPAGCLPAAAAAVQAGGSCCGA